MGSRNRLFGKVRKRDEKEEDTSLTERESLSEEGSFPSMSVDYIYIFVVFAHTNTSVFCLHSPTLTINPSSRSLPVSQNLDGPSLSSSSLSELSV